MTNVRSTILMSALCVLGACSLAFRQPVVTLDGVRVDAIGLRGGTLVAQVHIANPNSYGIRSERLTYALEVADISDAGERRWSHLAEGTFDEDIRLPGGGDAVIEVPIEFSYRDMGGVLSAILDRGTFDYRVRGTVDVREPARRTVPYRHTGRVSLSGVR
jgi:LEA14-like dessication related protein